MRKSILLLLLLASLALSSEQCQRLLNEGWCYIAPTPKSAQARHGNRDGRTTWWIGYWKNESLKECSGTVPRHIEKHNIIVGDGQSCGSLRQNYRRGGYIPLSSLENKCLCNAEE